MEYRKTLYENYHTTQSGRASTTDAKSLFLREKWRFQHEILPLFSQLDKNSKIYDMGCGSGSLIASLKENGFNHVLGIDLSQEQVQTAHTMGVNEVQFGDAIEHLKHNTQLYDVIVGTDIIEHFTKNELVELLQLIQKNLKPNGKAIFRTPNLDAPFASVFANGDFTHENYMNASSAQQVMMACGFPVVIVLPSMLQVQSPIKELIRKALYFCLNFFFKAVIFATGRSLQNILFTPNMIIVAQK
jgi:2-polyprenyl-3-methyl-5-hydroxy-6-metoxy-1,4-benzoquinol methylase